MRRKVNNTLVVFGGVAAPVGLVLGLLLPGTARVWLAALALLLAGAVAVAGTFAAGETAGGWLGVFIAGAQLAGFLVGLAAGGLISAQRERHRGVS